MARKRMINTSLFTNEEFGSLTDSERILYIGIIVNADDFGRMKASPKFLKATIFPYDSKSPGKVLGMRDRLKEMGLVKVYTVNGSEYLEHPDWERYQLLRKDRIQPSVIPSCQPSDNQETTKPPPDVGIDKVSLGKVSIDKDNVYSIFKHWNDQKIVTHKNLKNFEANIRSALKTYSLEEITEAITNYKKVLDSPEHFWTYNWTLKEFLNRGLDKFLTANNPLDNFKKRKEAKDGKTNRLSKYTTFVPRQREV